MKRRAFIQSLGAATIATALPAWPQPASSTDTGGHRLLILIALKGGNDGLNTVVPFADPHYYKLRPTLGIAPDQALKLTEKEGLHPQLEPLLAAWNARELAVLRGVGYPEPNLSHFRSMDIWETASRSNQTLTTGWLDRAFGSDSKPTRGTLDAIVVGTDETHCLHGGDARVITMADLGQFRRQAQLLGTPPSVVPAQASLRHLLQLERTIRASAARMKAAPQFKASFNPDPFGRAVRTACDVIASRDRVGLAVVHLSLNGFDTHIRQVATQARLLKTLSEGLMSLRAGLKELGAWHDTLVLTYSEFGRRPKENANAGTDHGTAAVHFAIGGRVKGGLHGAAPNLANLDNNGNARFTLDFRRIYATVLEKGWGMESQDVLGGRFQPLQFL